MNLKWISFNVFNAFFKNLYSKAMYNSNLKLVDFKNNAGKTRLAYMAHNKSYVNVIIGHDYKDCEDKVNKIAKLGR